MSAEPNLTPEFALGFRAVMLDGVLREMETTKKVLAAVPDDKSSYKHDPNARTAWELAWHLANTDVQFLNGIADMNFTMPAPAHKPTNIAELVTWYDSNFKREAARIGELSSEQLLTPVNFMGAYNFPVVFYLGFMNNHNIHHRGELATYLRPMGSKVPSIYGGSYDEPLQMPAPAQTDAA
jgi:uncharacterized damage-inducible protein DinB